MKKSLVALAALAVAGIASAQSSVTLFGVMDVGISGYSNKAENTVTGVNRTAKQTAMSTSGLSSSRIGFRGTEDLGGGLAASFWLEAGLNNDEGAGKSNIGSSGLDFSRRSTVSLSGNFGEVRLGRDQTPTYQNDSVFDPFGTNGVGTNLIYRANSGVLDFYGVENNYVRASNSIGYFTPANLGGFYGQLMYALDEGTSITGTQSDRSGRYIGGRVGYANGPLDVAVAYGESTVDSARDKHNLWNLGASYDFGVAKAFGELSSGKFKRGTPLLVNEREQRVDGWLLGVSAPVGAGLIRASYSAVKFKNSGPWLGSAFGFGQDGKADQWALGYVHNLSKRTSLYATVARLNNKDNRTADVPGLKVGGPAFAEDYRPRTSTGYDFGVKHSF